MDKRFAVRPVLHRDLQGILDIEAASFGADAYDRNLFAAYARQSPRLFLVAERRARVRGYSIAALLPGATRRRAELVSLAVHPAFRGQGAASALMDSTLRRLHRRGIARLCLMVKTTNRPARAFYEKYGFRLLRRVAGYYEDGSDGFSLVIDL